MLTNLQSLEQKCKELEEKYNRKEEDIKAKVLEKVITQQTIYKAELGAIIKIFNRDSEVSSNIATTCNVYTYTHRCLRISIIFNLSRYYIYIYIYIYVASCKNTDTHELANM